MLGGRGAAGFKRMLRMSKSMTAPLILMSATPPYNDVERVYCMEVLCDRSATVNYEAWLMQNCQTSPNRFGYYPNVDGLLYYDSPIDFLADRAWCAYVKDTAEWQQKEFVIPVPDIQLFERYGLNIREPRIMASRMEKDHQRVSQILLTDDGDLRDQVAGAIMLQATNVHDGVYHDKWLVFCVHTNIVDAFIRHRLFADRSVAITGETKDYERVKRDFISDPSVQFLVGTTALATGVDGIDKVCQGLILLDDTNDDAKRRQLIGRILPRGGEDDRLRHVLKAVFM